MDKLTIKKEITALINSIKEHSDNIAPNEEIPQLEFELIFHKIEKLYKKSVVYNYMNAIQVEATPVMASEKPVTATPVASQPVSPTPEPVAPKNNKPDPAHLEEQPKEVTQTPKDLFGAELPPASEKIKSEKKPDRKEEKHSAHTIQKPAISDINKAIGINDKFQFCNELFEGNMQEYNIAVQQLNSADTLESAMDYFNNLQQLYSWDFDNETVKRLADLVERRYS